MMIQYRIINDKDGIPVLKEIARFPQEKNGDKDGSVVEEIRLLNKYLDFDMSDSEHKYIVAKNNKHKDLYVLEAGLGSENSTSISHRSIGIFLCLVGATSFHGYHNHPNDILEASMADTFEVKHLRNISSLLEIEFRGDYIVTQDGFYDIINQEEYLWS